MAERDSWGSGVDPTSVFGLDALNEAAPREEEGQEGYPELDEFMKKFGPQKGDPTSPPPIQFTGVFYDHFNLMNQDHKLRLQALQTRLAKGKDCIICKEESFFTKEGQYIVVLKWAEYERKKPQAEPNEKDKPNG